MTKPQTGADLLPYIEPDIKPVRYRSRKEVRREEVLALREEGAMARNQGKPKQSCPQKYLHTMNCYQWWQGWDDEDRRLQEYEEEKTRRLAEQRTERDRIRVEQRIREIVREEIRAEFKARGLK